MAIWFKPYSLDEVRTDSNKYMAKFLNIEILEMGDDFISAKMPVDDRTKMPLGLLHGGASCVLAETLASNGSFLCIDPELKTIVGLEINANHIRSVTEGFVTGIATAIHIGRTTHVWEIKIYNEKKELVCISRMTIAILDKKIRN